MHRYTLTAAVIVAALLGPLALAASDEQVFGAKDHCVAYRTTKDMFFGMDVEVIGRSCDVTASLMKTAAGSEPRIVVTVPAKSFKSGNIMRNRTVSDLLGAKVQPDLLFTSSPLDAESLRADVDRGHFVLSGTLTLGGRDYPIDFPLELVEQAGGRYVKGHLETTVEAFEGEVPTVAFGLIASPHEELELIVHLDLERVNGLEAWAASLGLK
jgi:hypothetical protein